MRRRRRPAESREPGALYEGLRGGHQAGSDASARDLGRRAARDGWARRFLIDVVHGRLNLPSHSAVPALQELARVEPRAVLDLLRGCDPSASLIAGMALGRDALRFAAELVRATKAQEVTTRLAGVAGLAEAAACGQAEAVDALGAALGDSDGGVRWAAAIGLGRTRGRAASERALAWLRRALESGDDHAVSGAAFGAAAFWPARKGASASLLLDVAESGPSGLSAVALAVRKLPPSAARAAAAKCRDAADARVRALSVPAIGRWAAQGSRAALRDLRRLARDDDPRVRSAAAEAIGSSRMLGLGGLLAELSADASPLVRAGVAEGLARRADQRGASLLWQLVADGAVAVRAAAVRALGRMDIQDAVRRSCADHEPEVRAAATSVLAPRSAQDLSLLVKLSGDRDGAVVRAAAAALGRCVREQSGDAWERLLELAEQGPAVSAAVEAVASVLDRDPPHAAETFLRRQVGTTSPNVVARIARAAHDPKVAEIARTVWHVLEGDQELRTGMEDLSAACLAAVGEDWAELWHWLAECAGASRLAEVPAAAEPPPRSEHEAISHLAAVGRAVAGGLRAGREENRQRQLSRAKAGIEALLEHDGDDLLWLVAERIAGRWARLIESERESVAGPVIEARLTCSRVLVGPQAALCVELENVGGGAACDISVSFGGAEGPVGVGDLAPGDYVEVEAPLGPVEPGVRLVRGTVAFRSGGRRAAHAFDGTVAVVKAGLFEEVTNPFVIGKPLTAESAMFFGRGTEMAFVERALASGESGAVAVLYGQRRTGKTSLLRRLEARLADRYRVGFVDVQGMLVADTGAFFRELARSASGESAAGAMLSDGDAPAAWGAAGPDMVREAVGRTGRPVVFLLDEFDDLEQKVRSGRLSGELFDQLRNLIQHTPNISLVLSGTHRLEQLGGDRWSFLLNLATYRRIGCLGREEARQVLEVPLQRLGIVWEDAAMARVIRLTGGHPYFLQLLGYRLVERCVASRQAAVRVASVEGAADEVVEQGDMHLRYLWESAGSEAQEVLRALSTSQRGATLEELQTQTDKPARRMRETLGRLVASELAREVSGRYTVHMGLLSRWLRTVSPTNSGG